MIIYKIVRHIAPGTTILNCSLICTFPEGNRIISVQLTSGSQPIKVLKFKLDPDASTKVFLTTPPPKNET
jgi:hypothetical protein